MNYEKAYKEALERAKYLKENTDSVGAKDISYTFEYIFPELRESEDEKIRKSLIKSFENQHSCNFPTVCRCVPPKNEDGSIKLNTGNANHPQVIVIDSCEYIHWVYGLAHKGNCKYCAERRKKEQEELIKALTK